jgi:hypothetical protein
MSSYPEYLEEAIYTHECARLNADSNGKPNAMNLYGIASFLLTTGYCAHHETSDNGDAPRAKVRELIRDWLTEDRERNLFLRHVATLDAAAEEIAERMFAEVQ